MAAAAASTAPNGTSAAGEAGSAWAAGGVTGSLCPGARAAGGWERRGNGGESHEPLPAPGPPAGLAAAAASEPPENSAVATYRAWRAETDAAQAAYQANKDEALARFRRFTNKVHDAWQRNSPERILHLMRTPRMKVTMAKLPADQKNWTGRYLVKGRCGACQRKKLVPSIPLGYKNLTSSYG